MNGSGPREGGHHADTAAKPSDDTERIEVRPLADHAAFTDMVVRRAREREDRLARATAELEMDRRWREAAARLPPMADGRRDPLGTVTDGRCR